MLRLWLLPLMLTSCATDVSILKVNENVNGDTSEIIVDGDTTDQQDTYDNNNVDNDVDYTKVSGKVLYHFRQIACPGCVGESSEFDISAEVMLHMPTSGNYFDSYNY